MRDDTEDGVIEPLSPLRLLVILVALGREQCVGLGTGSDPVPVDMVDADCDVRV